MQLSCGIGTAPSFAKFFCLVGIQKPRNTGVNAQNIIIRSVNIQLCIFLNYTFIERQLQARIVKSAKIARPRRLVDLRLETKTVNIYKIPGDPRVILIRL